MKKTDAADVFVVAGAACLDVPLAAKKEKKRGKKTKHHHNPHHRPFPSLARPATSGSTWCLISAGETYCVASPVVAVAAAVSAARAAVASATAAATAAAASSRALATNGQKSLCPCCTHADSWQRVSQ